MARAPLKPLLDALGPAAASFEALADLEPRLQALLSRARAAWPALDVPDDAFFAYVGARLSRQRPPQDAIAEIQAEALYLACACAAADAKAMRLVEERYFDKIAQTVARIDPSLVDEVQQGMREKLFLRTAGAPSKLETYSGRGAFAGWLCAIAGRMALELREKAGGAPGSGGDVDLADLAGHAEDTHLQYVKARYREAYAQAFSAALKTLPAKERALLRLHFGSGLSLERIGQIYQAHKSTVSRWLAQARETLVEATRQELLARVQLRGEALDSLTAQIQSEIPLTLSSVWSKGENDRDA